jgi:putative glutamine amidotransferase
MSKKPVIGLTPLYDSEKKQIYMNGAYTGAVAAAGGIPVVLPLILKEEEGRTLLGALDGLLCTGGPDIMPHLYGEDTLKECGKQSALRDELELPLIREAVAAKVPVFGICRGIQSINVALGGTLYQDIPGQLTGRKPELFHNQSNYVESEWPMHGIKIEQNSILYGLVKAPRLMVNSYHHQAVKEPAPGLKITAWAEDGIIECIEALSGGFVLGVQWHPELMYNRDAMALGLFKLFIGECTH